MGQPKKHRPTYHRPKKPYDKARIEQEKGVLKAFGLRRKKEIWRAEEVLRSFRQRARELQATHDPIKQKDLLERVSRLGIQCANLDDVLEVKLEDLLNRRLQTVIFKKGMAHSVSHARQLIVHGHVRLSGKKVLWPSLIVNRGEEDAVVLNPRIAERLIKHEQPAEQPAPETPAPVESA